MTNMRITPSTVRANTLANLQGSMSRLQRLQGQLASGRQVDRPSDDPSATSEAMIFRSQIKRAEQYARNSDDARGWLGAADQAMSGALTLVRRARDLVVAGASGAASAEARSAMAAEIDGLREELIAVANTRYLDRPIFAGNANVDAAYNAAGAFAGDSGTVERTVAEGTRVTVNVDGEAVFGVPAGGGPRLFDLLATIAADLRAGNPAALEGTHLNALDESRELIQNRLTAVGNRYTRVETMHQRAEDLQFTLRASLSEVEDIDIPRTMIDLQMQEMAYKSALAAAAKIVQPSLVDFLR